MLIAQSIAKALSGNSLVIPALTKRRWEPIMIGRLAVSATATRRIDNQTELALG